MTFPILTPEAKAVLEAAEAVADLLKHNYSITSQAPIPQRLVSAIDAYLATQKPKDYAPEDIPVGGEFCFTDDERDEIPAIMMEDAGRMGRPRCWRRKGMHSVFPFSPGARLIPLQEPHE